MRAEQISASTPESTLAPASVSVMLWFRASPEHDARLAAALGRTAMAIARHGPARFGRRHGESRPYRTWMIDVGPIATGRVEFVLGELREAFARAGLPALADGEPRLETFEWLSDGSDLSDGSGNCADTDDPIRSDTD